MVDRLEHASHVERLRDSVDRQRVTVTATPSAQQTAYLAWGPLIGEMDEITGSLSAEERDTICRFLGKMIDVTRRGGRQQK